MEVKALLPCILVLMNSLKIQIYYCSKIEILKVLLNLFIKNKIIFKIKAPLLKLQKEKLVI